MDSYTIDSYRDACHVAELRGWDRAAHLDALESRDDDRIGLTHPILWLSEEEAEHFFALPVQR
jgi:hypothetical protein